MSLESTINLKVSGLRPSRSSELHPARAPSLRAMISFAATRYSLIAKHPRAGRIQTTPEAALTTGLSKGRRTSIAESTPPHSRPYTFLAGDSSQNEQKIMVLTGKYDLSFPFELSQEAFAEFDRHGLDYELTTLPCGHYTMGQFPFYIVAGFSIVNFLRRFRH